MTESVCDKCQCGNCIRLMRCTNSCEDCERHLWPDQLNDCNYFISKYKARRRIINGLYKKYEGVLYDGWGCRLP